MAQIPTRLEVDRHRAAMTRVELSRPARLAIEAGIITSETTIFDYGCGLGGDVKRLTEAGYQCAGWDPYYFPDVEWRSADVVNLSYIINVIEDPDERDRSLQQAWALTGQVLIVAAQILVNELRGVFAYGDGILTKRNTFQKYYQQGELKEYIDRILAVEAIRFSAFSVSSNAPDVFAARSEEYRFDRIFSATTHPLRLGGDGDRFKFSEKFILIIGNQCFPDFLQCHRGNNHALNNLDEANVKKVILSSGGVCATRILEDMLVEKVAVELVLFKWTNN